MTEPAHEELTREAMQLLRDRHEDRALAILERLVVAMPHREDLQIALAYCHGRLENVPDAHRICARLESTGDSLRVRQLRSFVNRQAKRYGLNLHAFDAEPADTAPSTDRPLPGMLGPDVSDASLVARLTDIQQRLERELHSIRDRETHATALAKHLEEDLNDERDRAQVLEARTAELEDLLAEFGLQSLDESSGRNEDSEPHLELTDDEIERLRQRIEEKDVTLSSVFRRNADLTQRVTTLEDELYAGAEELNNAVREANTLRGRVDELSMELGLREDAVAQSEAHMSQLQQERDDLRGELHRLLEAVPIADIETMEGGGHPALDRLREENARIQARESSLARALEESETALAEQVSRAKGLETEIADLDAQARVLEESIRLTPAKTPEAGYERVAKLESALAAARCSLAEHENALAEIHRVQDAVDLNRADAMRESAEWETAVESLRAAETARDAEVAALQEEIRDRDASMEAIRAELSAARIETTQLRTRAEELAKELDRRTSDFEHGQHVAASETNAEIQSAFEERDALMDETRETLLALDNRLREMESTPAPSLDTDTPLTDLTDTLSRRIEDETNRRNEYEDRIRELEGRLNSTREAEGSLQHTLHAAKSETESVRAQLESLHGQLHQAETGREALQRTQRETAERAEALRTEAENARQAMAALQDKHDGTLSRLEERETLLLELRSTVAERDEEVATLRQRVDESTSESERLSGEMAELRERVADSNARLEARAGEIERLQRALDHALARERQADETELKRLADIELLEHQLAAREQELLRAHADGESIASQLSAERTDLSEIIKELRDALRDTETKLADATDQLMAREAEIVEKQSRLADSEARLEKVSGERNQFKTDATTLEEQISTTELRLRQATETIGALEERIDDDTRERGALQRTLDETREDLGERTDKVEALTADVKRLTEARDAIRDKLHAAEATNVEQQTRLTERGVERDTLRQERDTLAARVEAFERETQLLREQRQGLQARLDTAERDFDATQRTLNETEQALGIAESRIDDLKSMTAGLQNDVHGRNTRIAELESVRHRLEGEMDEGRVREGNLRRDLDARQTTIKGLRDELTDADAQTRSLESELTALGTELMRREHALDEAKEESKTIERGMEELKARVHGLLNEEFPRALEDRVAALRKAKMLQEEIDLLRKQIW